MKPLLSALGRLYSFVLSLILTVGLGAITWGAWSYYQDIRLENKFFRTGQRLPVTVDHADYRQRSWRDIMSRTAYLSFRYRGKDYTTRYVVDSAYISAGDRVSLLYHPDYDAFRQARHLVRADSSIRKSRLVTWTSIRDFSAEHQVLFFCILLASVTFFLASGLIVSVVPLPFLQHIARLVLCIELLLAALFFTYDTYQYYHYYQRLKATGQPVAARVLDTTREAVGRQQSDDLFPWYEYSARVQYQQQERIIPISDDDFETRKPNDTLQAVYSPSLDDAMSVEYTPDYRQVLMPAFFWLIAILLIRPGFGRKSSQPSSVR